MAESSNSTTSSRRLFLSAGSAAAVFGSLKATAANVTPLPVETSCLAQEFEAAWAAERAIDAAYLDIPEMDEAWEAAHEPAAKKTSAIVKRIIADSSCDLEGLKLKARAYLWCYRSDLEEALGVLWEEASATDCRLLHAIMRDLLALT